jgi:hypothetical protein
LNCHDLGGFRLRHVGSDTNLAILEAPVGSLMWCVGICIEAFNMQKEAMSIKLFMWKDMVMEKVQYQVYFGHIKNTRNLRRLEKC